MDFGEGLESATYGTVMADFSRWFYLGQNKKHWGLGKDINWDIFLKSFQWIGKCLVQVLSKL